MEWLLVLGIFNVRLDGEVLTRLAALTDRDIMGKIGSYLDTHDEREGKEDDDQEVGEECQDHGADATTLFTITGCNTQKDSSSLHCRFSRPC